MVRWPPRHGAVPLGHGCAYFFLLFLSFFLSFLDFFAIALPPFRAPAAPAAAGRAADQPRVAPLAPIGRHGSYWENVSDLTAAGKKTQDEQKVT